MWYHGFIWRLNVIPTSSIFCSVDFTNQDMCQIMHLQLINITAFAYQAPILCWFFFYLPCRSDQTSFGKSEIKLDLMFQIDEHKHILNQGLVVIQSIAGDKRSKREIPPAVFTNLKTMWIQLWVSLQRRFVLSHFLLINPRQWSSISSMLLCGQCQPR